MAATMTPKGPSLPPGPAPQQSQQQRQVSPPTAQLMSASPSLAIDPGNLSTDDVDTGTAEAKRQGVRNPACDHCREKKIRCDREKPLCMNCRTANIYCKYSEPQKRPSDVSRNIHRFQEVNQRLDRIENSIAALTSAITALAKGPLANQKSHSGPCSCNSSSPNSTTEGTPKSRAADEFPSPGEATQSVPSVIASYIQLKGRSFLKSRDIVNAPVPEQPLYMGSSSIASMTNDAELLAHAKLGTKEMAVRGGRPHRQEKSDQEAKTTESGPLDRLGIISKKVAGLIPHYSHRILRDDAAHFERSIPSREEATELVNIYFKTAARWYPIFNEEKFRRDFEKMYDEPQVSIKDGAWVTCFNCVMLFGMHARVVNMTLRERLQLDLSTYSRTILSFYNAWAALDDLEIFITPTVRNIQALVSMGITAIEISRPALSWSLFSQAARSAQALGLHRRSQLNASNLTSVDIEERKTLFWQIHIWLTTLSLTLGRSAQLPEWELDAELPTDNGDPGFQFILARIGLSRVEGHIYIGLYSAAAAAKTPQALNDTIEELLDELETWWEEWKHLATPPPQPEEAPDDKDPGANENNNTTDCTNPQEKLEKTPHFTLFQHLHIEFNYYNLTALILRMARPGMGVYSATKTLNAARKSIEITMSTIRKYPDLGSSALPLWLFSCHPFTSFFVLFSSIIRNPSSPESTATDLPLMNRLVGYFTALSKRNEGAARLLAVTSSFTNVAASFLKNYQEAKKRKRADNDEGGPNESPNGGVELSHADIDAELPDLPLHSGGIDITEDLFASMGDPDAMGIFPPSTVSPNHTPHQAGIGTHGTPAGFGFHPHAAQFAHHNQNPLFTGHFPHLYRQQQASPGGHSTHSPHSPATGPGGVDFATASFLRWPGVEAPSHNGGGLMATVPPSLVLGGSGGSSGGGGGGGVGPHQHHNPHHGHGHPGQQHHHGGHAGHPHHGRQGRGGSPGHGTPVNLEHLMSEPLDFQMRMEQAARRGPMEFDWFGWEGTFGAVPGRRGQGRTQHGRGGSGQ